MLLAVPETKTKLYGDSAPRLWNALLVDIKNSESLKSLKFEHFCSASAIEYRDQIAIEYRDYYYHYYIILLSL